jgi:methionyl aminopeptidase
MSLQKTEEEINLIRISSLLVGKTLAEVAKHIKPGITTAHLDKIAEEYIRDNGGVPSFKGYYGFPASLCISVNDVVVHGIPGLYEIKDGDIVSVDCGVLKNGFHGDSAYSFAVGNVEKRSLELLERTKQSLYNAIEVAIAGNRIGDIGYAVQSYVEGFGYGVVRDLVGHGLGSRLHEKPEVPNYGRRGTGSKLLEGMVLAIEPMINLGTSQVHYDKDGWTIRSADRLPSAHFEHDIVVRKGKAEILSTFEYIEEVVKTLN